jgi:GntR family transcriptional regulator
MYYRIEQAILEQIQQGQLRPGAQLPSETELAQLHHVSRITAKRALDDLVQQGRAFRQQGRGTFVAHARISEISGFRSFSDDIRARGLIPASQVLTLKEVEPEAALRERLHLAEGEKAIVIKRLRLASDDPVAIETAYVPSRLCPGLLQEDLATGSLYSILQNRYNIQPTWADAEIEAAPATKEEALLLKMKAGKPVLIARRVTFSASYDVIESVYSVYRGDRFTFYTGRQNLG